MIVHCPFCGHSLPRVLVSGITSCNNCRRTCDSAKRNQLLSLAWAVRKHNADDAEWVANKFGVSTEDAEYVIRMVIDENYSHEEFSRLLPPDPRFGNKAS